MRPELKLAETLAIPAETLAVLRGSGFAVAHFVPRRGIVRGTSVVAGLSDAGINKSLMRDDAGQVVSIELDPTGYPGSLMGAVAVIRQAFMDAHWYHDVWEAYAKSKAKPRPEANEALAAPCAWRSPTSPRPRLSRKRRASSSRSSPPWSA